MSWLNFPKTSVLTFIAWMSTPVQACADEVSQSIFTMLNYSSDRYELRISSEPLKLSPDLQRDSAVYISVWNIPMRFSTSDVTRESHFSWSFNLTQKDIPNDFILPEDIKDREFSVMWKWHLTLQYKARNYMLQWKISDRNTCDIWLWGGISAYSFSALWKGKVWWDMDNIPFLHTWYLVLNSKSDFYNPFMQANLECQRQVHESFTLKWDMMLKWATFHSQAGVNIEGKYNFNTDVSLTWIISKEYNLYDTELWEYWLEKWWWETEFWVGMRFWADTSNFSIQYDIPEEKVWFIWNLSF